MPHDNTVEGTIEHISGVHQDILHVRSGTGVWSIKLNPNSTRPALGQTVTLVRDRTTFSVAERANQGTRDRAPQAEHFARPHEQPDVRLQGWPYNFVRLDAQNAVLSDVRFHHGVNSAHLQTGVLNITWTVLTPTLVGHEQVVANTIRADERWELEHVEFPANGKKVILPLRADWLAGAPVVWQGSGIKGAIRNGVASLLASPMERVAERHFTYRPNLDQRANGGRLVRKYGVVTSVDPLKIKIVDSDKVYFVNDSQALQLLEASLMNPAPKTATGIRVDVGHGRKKLLASPQSYWNVPAGGLAICRYHHGADGSAKYLSAFKPKWQITPHPALVVEKSALDSCASVEVPYAVIEQYKTTKAVMCDDATGHRLNHPLKDAKTTDGTKLFPIRNEAFATLEKDDAIVLETDDSGNIVTMGHHFYYRAAYADSVRQRLTLIDGKFSRQERPEVQNLKGEGVTASGGKLAGARSIFGYVATQGRSGVQPQIGGDDFSRLSGRIAANHALEVVEAATDDSRRFLNSDGQQKSWVAFPQQGSPKPSAVEGYLLQEDAAGTAPRATLRTYGDTFYIQGAEDLHNRSDGLRGRKVYPHQCDVDVVKSRLQLESTKVNEANAMLGRFVSAPKTKFKSSIHYSDLELWELGALLASIDPGDFVNWLRRTGSNLLESLPKTKRQIDLLQTEYGLKFGFGRGLGMGSVAATIDNLEPLHRETSYDAVIKKIAAIGDDTSNRDLLDRRLAGWIRARQYSGTAALDYPKEQGETLRFHSAARTQHAIGRRNGVSDVSKYILTPLEEL